MRDWSMKRVYFIIALCVCYYFVQWTCIDKYMIQYIFGFEQKKQKMKTVRSFENENNNFVIPNE